MKFSKVGEPELAAARGAHDSLGHGLAESVGIADGQNDIAHTQRIGAPHGHDGQVADRQMQYREIRIGILAHHGCLGDPSVRQLHTDRVGAGDHVLVGDDGPLGIDDHTRPRLRSTCWR